MGPNQAAILKDDSGLGKCLNMLLLVPYTYLSCLQYILDILGIFLSFFAKRAFQQDAKFTKCSTLLFLELFWRKRAQVYSFTKRLLKDHILLPYESELRIFAYSSCVNKFVSFFGLSFCTNQGYGFSNPSF